ncbi:MAG: signal peptidase I [Dokdonella sp.]
MNFNFPLLLVVLTASTGLVWLVDRWFLAPARRRRADDVQAMALSATEREARAQTALKIPLAVEYARSFFPVLLGILLFRSFLAEPYKIPSGSMMPTLLVGDFILVNKFAYGMRLPVTNTKVLDVGEPKRGEVFVFRYPKDPSENYIKRVVGLPGDEITYRDKTLFVNGTQVSNSPLGPYTGPADNGRSMAEAQVKQEVLGGVEHRIMEIPRAWSAHDGTWVVPPGQYFAMGDSRDNSEDSRMWGFVPEENLVGPAFAIWMNFDDGISFSRIGTLIR